MGGGEVQSGTRWGCNQGRGHRSSGAGGRCQGINFYQRGSSSITVHGIKGVFRNGGGFHTQWGDSLTGGRFKKDFFLEKSIKQITLTIKILHAWLLSMYHQGKLIFRTISWLGGRRRVWGAVSRREILRALSEGTLPNSHHPAALAAGQPRRLHN